MVTNPRQQRLIDEVKRRGFMSVDGLAQLLEVTAQTIRRDVSALAQAGLLARFHGGVGVPSSTVENIAYSQRQSLNADGKRQFYKGKQNMDGATALDYARERYAFKDGDFARVRHQQEVIKAIMNKAASGGMLTNPVKLNSFLRATANAVSVDGTLNIIDTGSSLRHLRSSNLTFFTSPTKGTGMIGTQSVVLPDKEKSAKFFEALRNDDLATAQKVGQK